MPVVLLQYKADRVPEEIVAKLAKRLTELISEALDVPENQSARLHPEDIEIFVTPSQKLDLNTKHLEIMVWAHQYPERLLNLEDRKDKVLYGVKAFLAMCDLDVSGWVWILLQPTSFGAF